MREWWTRRLNELTLTKKIYYWQLQSRYLGMGEGYVHMKILAFSYEFPMLHAIALRALMDDESTLNRGVNGIFMGSVEWSYAITL